MEINHMSPSRYEIFDTCPQKYKYRYHLKQASTLPEPFYFVYGKIIHKIAEIYVERKGQCSILEIANDIMQKKIAIENNKFAPEIPYEYKIRMPEHLRSIKKLCEKVGFDGETEYKFSYDLDPPNNKNVDGVIDRFILKNDKCWVIDYKTTKKGSFRKTPITITADIQLRTYARVIQKTFNIKPENIKLALYYLEGGDLVGVNYSEKSLEEVEKQLLEAYLKIENVCPDTVIGIVGRHCNNCEYNNVCPFYRKV